MPPWHACLHGHLDTFAHAQMPAHLPGHLPVCPCPPCVSPPLVDSHRFLLSNALLNLARRYWVSPPTISSPNTPPATAPTSVTPTPNKDSVLLLPNPAAVKA